MPPDDEHDDAFGYQPPLPPEDRLWRHPSELGAGRGGSVTIVHRPKVATRVWAVGIVCALLGSAATLGVLAATGALDGDRGTPPVQFVPIEVPREAGPDELSWAEPVLPAVARVEARTSTGMQSGTAVVYQSDGHLITTADAVKGADRVDVTFSDGETEQADIVGIAHDEDIAVLRVDRSDLPTATMGSAASLELGERAVVISSVANRPSAPTVGVGLISGLSQRVEDADGSVLHDMVQTNVRLAPDATGSPLVDSSGTVVGIITRRGADRSDAERSQDSGTELEVRHATTIEWAKRVADDLVTTGRVRQVWLGVRGANLTEDEVATLGRGGAKLVSVADGSPAAQAGLRAGDVVLAIDAHHVTTSSDLVVALRAMQPGDTIAISYRRGTEQGSTLATLVEKPWP